ncbi:MAG TPA: S66 peptidase family protein, partial [Myxococcota bacterium]
MQIRAPRLRRGDSVGIVSPSWGGAASFPHRVARGVAQLESLGFRVKIGRHALNERGFVSDSPENRASDLHELFSDPEVGLILAAIGGDHSCHLLPHLDFDGIRAHPKLLMGYSDITVLNVAIWKETGLVTFNGPALLTDFAEHPQMLEYTRSWFVRAVCNAAPIGAIEPAQTWTEEFLDWREKKDLERPRSQQPSEGWVWLKPGVADGVLVGGCLESLQHLRGTRFWPSWDGAILFFETSEEEPPPAKVDGMLMDYENMGVFAQIRGMLVGRPMGYSRQEKRELHQVLLERTKGYAFPIV